MKKILVFSFLLFLNNPYAFSRDLGLGFGIQGGGGIAFNNRESDSKETRSPGFSISPSGFIEYNFYDYYIGSRISIKYNFINFGIEVKNENDKKANFSVSNHYLSIPIFLKFVHIQGFSLNFGPEFIFNISSAIEKKSGDKNGPKNLNRAFKGFVFGIIASIEYETEMGLNFGIETDVTISGIDSYANDEEKKNNSSEFEKNQNNFKSGNIFSAIIKIGYNFAKLIDDGYH